MLVANKAEELRKTKKSQLVTVVTGLLIPFNKTISNGC